MTGIMKNNKKVRKQLSTALISLHLLSKYIYIYTVHSESGSKVMQMATISFSKPLEIMSDESALALIEAAEDKSSHKPIKRVNISRELERGLPSLKKRYSH